MICFLCVLSVEFREWCVLVGLLRSFRASFCLQIFVIVTCGRQLNANGYVSVYLVNSDREGGRSWSSAFIVNGRCGFRVKYNSKDKLDSLLVMVILMLRLCFHEGCCGNEKWTNRNAEFSQDCAWLFISSWTTQWMLSIDRNLHIAFLSALNFHG